LAVFRKAAFAVLANGAAELNLGGAAGDLIVRRIDVPEYATNLTVAISGGWGDCDLILRYGEMPDTNAYDYYPALAGNDESVSVANPRAGSWYALLAAGPSGFGGVRLTAAYQVDIPAVDAPFVTPAGGIKVGSVQVAMTCATMGARIRYTLNGSEPTAASTLYSAPFKLNPTPLTTVKAKAFKAGRPDSPTVSVDYQIALPLKAGTAVVASGSLNSLAYYAFKAPAGSPMLVFTLTGGTGNANLHVSRGVFPTTAVFERGSVVPGNNEVIILSPAVSGQWYYVLVHGKAAFQKAALLLKVQ
jgi:hypothetical protein